MNELIISLLTPFAPTTFQTYNGKKTTNITFFNYLENVESYADNHETSIGYFIQVDVWSLENLDLLAINVLKTLKEAGFMRNYVTEMYESDTKKFHKVIRVNKTIQI